MKPSFSLSSLLACALWTAATANSSAESSPYRGLWVGEVALGKVNEVTTEDIVNLTAYLASLEP